MQFLDPRLPKRFWNKVVPCPMSGCWIWVGCTTKAGYGLFANGPTRTSAPTYTHRLSYIVEHGSIENENIDHLCRNTACCNPRHLEAVTHRENMLRGVNPTAKNASATYCKWGHEFTTANTHTDKHGHRKCRRCAVRNETARKRRIKQRT